MSNRPLYLISDGRTFHNPTRSAFESLRNELQQILAAAQDIVGYFQLREAPVPEDFFEEILTLCDEHSIGLIVSRDISRAKRSAGVHLGASGPSISECSVKLPGKLIGYSAHSAQEALDAAQQGADYVFLSPIWDPISKPAEREALGLDELRACVEQVSIPVYALGGITPERAEQALNIGADGIACIGSFFVNPDWEKTLEEFKLSLRSH